MIFINVDSALTILAKPMTVDTDACFLIVSMSCFVLLILCSYTIESLIVKNQFQNNIKVLKLPVDLWLGLRLPTF